jgi:hypothetical protein
LPGTQVRKNLIKPNFAQAISKRQNSQKGLKRFYFSKFKQDLIASRIISFLANGYQKAQ